VPVLAAVLDLLARSRLDAHLGLEAARSQLRAPEAFLDSTGSPTSPQKGTHHASPTMCPGFTWDTGHTLTPQTNKRLGSHTATPHH
jgi:Tfp pilus assembly protein PilX